MSHDEGQAAELPVWRGEQIVARATIDAGEYLSLASFRWVRDANGYVYRRHDAGGRLTHLYLHRIVSQAPPRLIVTFDDGDPLNCRRANLCVHQGAHVKHDRRPRPRPYSVRVSVDNRQHGVGGWATRRGAEEAAARLAPVAAGLRGRGLSRAEVRRALVAAAEAMPRRYASDRAASGLLTLAAALVPTHHPEPVREEAAQAIAVDLMTARVTREELDAKAVRRYVHAAYGMQDAHRFRSLDAPAGDEDGRTLGELFAA